VAGGCAVGRAPLRALRAVCEEHSTHVMSTDAHTGRSSGLVCNHAEAQRTPAHMTRAHGHHAQMEHAHLK